MITWTTGTVAGISAQGAAQVRFDGSEDALDVKSSGNVSVTAGDRVLLARIAGQFVIIAQIGRVD